MTRRGGAFDFGHRGDWIRVAAPASNNANAGRPVILFVPKASVFGEDWGKEVRRLVLALKSAETHVYVPLDESVGGLPDDLREEASRLCLMLAGSASLPEKEVMRRVDTLLWLHPAGNPESIFADRAVPPAGAIYLPLLDTEGQATLWRAFAEEKDWEIRSSGSFNQDIRSVWPEVVTPILEAGLSRAFPGDKE